MLLLALLLGCPKIEPDPAVRPFYALPLAAPEDGAPFADEHALFDVVQDAYIGLGWDTAAGVHLVLDPEVAIPFAREGDIYVTPFLGPDEVWRSHLSAVSRAFYGGRLDDYEASFPTVRAAAEAYRAFMTVAVVHEVAHAIAQRRNADRTRTDPHFEELRAIRLERAVTGWLVDRGQLPPELLPAYDRFNQVLLAAAPPDLELPTDPNEERQGFNAHYSKMLAGIEEATRTGTHPAQESVDFVLAVYSTYRRAVHAASPTVADVADELDRTVMGALVEGLADFDVRPEGRWLRFDLPPASWEVQVNLGSVYIVGVLPPVVPAGRRGAVLELANLVHDRAQVGRLRINGDDRLEIYVYARDPSPDDALWFLDRAHRQLVSTAPKLDAVIGGATPADAVREPDDAPPEGWEAPE